MARLMYRFLNLPSVLKPCKKIAVGAFALFWIVARGARVARSQPKRHNDFVLSAPVGSDTGVRWFYYSGGDVIDGPLIFRPVEPGSPRLNTVAGAKGEFVTYVSFDEMSQLMERLTRLDLRWKESKKVERFKPFSVMDEPSVNVDIEVVNSAGTAKVKLNGTLACEKLAPLDSVFQTRRALLEFQEFRFEMNCSISGFNQLEYMQMVLREHTPKPHGSSPN
jgi:hypothetical protein